ncbi:3-hydroxyacyl-CoA dehydrogenase NAD-binding domain-containing protein [uncultured Bartonella sp.]|uniref:3-hydroxyacyl-CoA dehydrogenase NAD-binding domain-containing protein n=1 Tax=uncultured Bartonella sp. TaxID=104108 RepID=UPI0026067812|nr:3-hydroxyacyl-CoA dehydrogenase NAD-binding domain-containing protein [uncultured Bartonella sp.]
MAGVVSYEIREGVAVIKLDNPPVNALSHTLRAELDNVLDKIAGDKAISSAVITSNLKTFIAGADIGEFGKPAHSPTLIDIINKIRYFDIPVVAAINGVAFGGGAEIALSCCKRIGGKNAQIGVPEINLGLIPGAGALQFLPPLIGVEKTFEMANSGKPVSAKTALALGIVSQIAEGDLVGEAVGEAKKLANAQKTNRPDDNAPICTGDKKAFEALAAKTKNANRDNPAIDALIDVMHAGFYENFAENLQRTRMHFVALQNDERSKAMRYAFFAERSAVKIDTGDTNPVEIKSIAVIGAGTMGTGIAMACASNGFPVTLIEMSSEPLERGLKKISDTYLSLVKRGRLSEEAGKKCIGAIKGTIGLEQAADADLVIEAVFEDMAVKKEIFAALDRIVKPAAILATNTSYLDVNEIAGVTQRAENILGLHFFSPANIMRLLEVVRAEKTALPVLAGAVNFARKIGKIPVVVGVCYGFVGNRMLARRTIAAEKLLQDGALPWQVDKAMTDFGFRMGPFAVSDLAGLDIGWSNRKATGQIFPIADAICELGYFGQKTGRGYYIYKDGSHTGERDPEIEKLIEDVSKKSGIKRREITEDEIIERLIYPMINEAARIIEEGIVSRARDIDVIWLNGYGWPIWRGGPIYYADHKGLKIIAERLEHYARQLGDDSLYPAPLLEHLVKTNGRFEA